MLVRLGIDAFGLTLCLFIFAMRRALGSSPFARVCAAAVLAPIAAAICTTGSVLIEHLSSPNSFGPTAAELLRTFARWAWFFLGWAGLTMALEYSFEARKEEIRAIEFRAFAQHAQLKALHSQINPHFLFNSLNSVSALIGDRRPSEADRVLDLLSTYFRKTLTIDPSKDISLRDEIRLHVEYLEIEKIRFPNLTVSIEVPDDIANARVLPLILQPLVENAIKHGAGHSLEPSSIDLRAWHRDQTLVLDIRNSRSSTGQVKPAGSGLGLQNVHQRLESRFGAKQTIAISESPRSFAVRITMPLSLS